MNLNLSSIQSDLDAYQVPLEDRGRVCNIAAARVIAYNLPLPPEAVESPKIYYQTQCAAEAERAVAKVNEKVVLDFDDVARMIQAIWMVRYSVAHDPHNPAMRHCLDQTLRAVNTPQVAPEVVEVVSRYPAQAFESLTRHFNQPEVC